jgi:regulator of replication initiation timing
MGKTREKKVQDALQDALQDLYQKGIKIKKDHEGERKLNQIDGNGKTRTFKSFIKVKFLPGGYVYFKWVSLSTRKLQTGKVISIFNELKQDEEFGYSKALIETFSSPWDVKINLKAEAELKKIRQKIKELNKEIGEEKKRERRLRKMLTKDGEAKSEVENDA